MQTEAVTTKRMISDKRFWLVGKWVAFTFMWLGVLGLFAQMVAEKMYGVHVVSLRAAGTLTGVGMVVGAIARAMNKVVVLHEDAKR